MRRIDQILDTLDTSQMHKFDRTNFLLYCNYMMFNTIKSAPPDVPVEEYYRSLYKHIEMIYEEQFHPFLPSNL